MPIYRSVPFVLAMAALLLLLGFIGDISLGSVHIPWEEVISVLLHGDTSSTSGKIIWNLRLPRAIVGILAGSGLAVAGLQMQALFQNPLAGPSVLGITSGSTLGVALAIFALGHSGGMMAISQLGIGGQWLLTIAAVVGAILTLLLILAIAVRISSPTALLIIGLMVGHLTVALVGIWQYFSAPERIKDFLLWTFGSLDGVYGDRLWVMGLAVLLGLILSVAVGKSLNVLLLGEDYARSMGLSLQRARVGVILATGILAGSITGFCGPIAFVGIAVPHICRNWLQSSDYYKLLPTCILLGAGILLSCDVIAHLPNSSIRLPINAVTSLIGSPVVIIAVMRRKWS